VTQGADPERAHVARRMAVRHGLTYAGMSIKHAEAWCDAWEAEATARGFERDSPDFWRHGEIWIAEQRRTRRTPG
jgi:hypothetical protein